MVVQAEAIVVGSGPSGWAAIESLISSGVRPTLIDISHRSTDGLIYRTPGTAGTSEVAKKRRFGSGHMYEFPDDGVKYSFEGSMPISGALGGLGTVWGSNIQVYPNMWSDSYRDAQMMSAYSEILKRIPHTGSRDDLDNVGEWPIPFPDETPQSRRVHRIQRRAKRSRSVYIGMGRNATAGPRTGCIRCGQCLLGCPRDVIFSTESRVLELIRSGAIEYVRGRVNRVLNSEGVLTAEVFDDEQSVTLVSAPKVFIAAGTIQSALILKRSEIIKKDLSLSDTQVFYVPFIAFRDLPARTTDYGLAQLMAESHEDLTGRDGFHVSIYEHSDSFKERAAAISPVLAKLVPRFIYKFLMAGIGFAPSSVSGQILIRGGADNLEVQTLESAESEVGVRNILKRSSIDFLKAGLFPVTPLVTLANVGASYHLGRLVDENDCAVLDDLGKVITGSDGLHVVDGCALPSLPAGPVTLAGMANAWRIVKEVIR